MYPTGAQPPITTGLSDCNHKIHSFLLPTVESWGSNCVGGNKTTTGQSVGDFFWLPLATAGWPTLGGDMNEIANPARPGGKRPAGKVTPRESWWINTTMFAQFLDHLLQEQGFTSEELINVVRKPWSWTPEFNEWLGREVGNGG